MARESEGNLQPASTEEWQTVRDRAVADIDNLLIEFDWNGAEQIEEWMNDHFFEDRIKPIVQRLNSSLRTLFPHINEDDGPIIICPFDGNPHVITEQPLGDDWLYILLNFPIAGQDGLQFQFGSKVCCMEVRAMFRTFLKQWENEIELLRAAPRSDVVKSKARGKKRKAKPLSAEHRWRIIMVGSRRHQRTLNNGRGFDCYLKWANSEISSQSKKSASIKAQFNDPTSRRSIFEDFGEKTTVAEIHFPSAGIR
jgi:hypothetical protein